jgi:hypothetical protein
LTECPNVTTKLCDNPCKEPNFLFTNENGLCYSSKALADEGKKECGTFCGYDKSLLTSCDIGGDGSARLCTNKCKNQDFIYWNSNEKLCYRTFA